MINEAIILQYFTYSSTGRRILLLYYYTIYVKRSHCVGILHINIILCFCF